MKKVWVLVLGCLLGSASSGVAEQITDPVKLRQFADQKIKPWLYTPMILEAVKAQNQRTHAFTQEDIRKLDKKWEQEDPEFLKSVLDNKLSDYLKDILAKSEGLYTEIFIMDDKGLNVGQTEKTSDYWQGDEAKYLKTCATGADTIHQGDVDLDESTQVFQSQISLPIIEDGKCIGAVTVGVDADQLDNL